MRERPVPCRGATLAESRDGVHQTWELDAICPACKRKRDAVVAQLKAQQKC